MFWERKGSTTTKSPPAYLLRLFGMHQCYHRYVPRFNYISGVSNPVEDTLFRCFDLTWPELILQLYPSLCQKCGYQVLAPPSAFASTINLALLQKQYPKECVLVALAPPSGCGTSGSASTLSRALTPFSKPLRTNFESYKFSCTDYVSSNLRPTEIKSGLGRL